MNVFNFVGNLGKDCRTGDAGGTPVCNFSVAVKSGYGQREQTLWIDCAFFGKRAEGGITQYLTKGKKVAVCGELGTREHEGKTYLTCRVMEITLCGGDDGQPRQAPPKHQAAGSNNQPSSDFDDDVPF